MTLAAIPEVVWVILAVLAAVALLAFILGRR